MKSSCSKPCVKKDIKLPYHVVNDPTDIVIQAIKQKAMSGSKPRLFLDVDGTLVAMNYNPNYMKPIFEKSGKEVTWDSVHRTDFCHWINSIHSVLDKLCDVFVLTNFTYNNEKNNKHEWLKENLKCKYTLILNKEGITKSLFVKGKQDILVDDTLRNLDEWHKAGGSIFAYQFVTCEKGRRELLKSLMQNVKTPK